MSRYHDQEGFYIDVVSRGRVYYLAWHDGEGDVGLFLGEHRQAKRCPKVKRGAIELWVAQEAAKHLADESRQRQAFVYQSETSARKALAAVNNALLGKASEMGWASGSTDKVKPLAELDRSTLLEELYLLCKEHVTGPNLSALGYSELHAKLLELNRLD